MQNLPYFIMAGALLVTLGIAIVGGGAYWILVALVWPIVAIYAFFDRRLKRHEGPGERLAAEAKPDHT